MITDTDVLFSDEFLGELTTRIIKYSRKADRHASNADKCIKHDAVPIALVQRGEEHKCRSTVLELQRSLQGYCDSKGYCLNTVRNELLGGVK